MLNIIMWKWHQRVGKRGEHPFRETYTPTHVHALIHQLKTFCKLSFRIIVVTDDPIGLNCETFPLWPDHSNLPNYSGANLPSCYRRLRIFDPVTQRAMGITPGERIVSLDLDALIVNDVTPLFDRPDECVFYHVPGTRVKTVLNGSLFLFTAGRLDWLWTEFDPLTSPRDACKKGYLGSDQAYLSAQLLGKSFVGRWTADQDGVYSFYRDIRIRRASLAKARIVFWSGRIKPWHREAKTLAPWVSRYVNYDLKPPTQEHPINVARTA